MRYNLIDFNSTDSALRIINTQGTSFIRESQSQDSLLTGPGSAFIAS